MSCLRQQHGGRGYPDLKPLLDLYLARVRDRLGERVTAVALYGSVARGQAQAASDVDLFVVHRGARAAVFEVFLEVSLQLRDHPLVCELQARDIPTEPYAVFRTETELADDGVHELPTLPRPIRRQLLRRRVHAYQHLVPRGEQE